MNASDRSVQRFPWSHFSFLTYFFNKLLIFTESWYLLESYTFLFFLQEV